MIDPANSRESHEDEDHTSTTADEDTHTDPDTSPAGEYSTHH